MVIDCKGFVYSKLIRYVISILLFFLYLLLIYPFHQIQMEGNKSLFFLTRLRLYVRFLSL